ncbi:ribosomal protein S18 acetylase RimI-like enzyme [Gracilibacillus halotolerans]|uniref:Ribosomal protein S18 acetylase RimI-like enzyme n=2 Tax=Gracilibacillus halotolerans TaxID=74386 RepID=A0A841RML2_9BACI|nr:ribosomal protein S18 acetylase RimI-like enzyme [Gracilibacillus halotolerans]
MDLIEGNDFIMDIRRPNDSELEKIILLSPQALFDGTLGEVSSTIDKVRSLIEPLLKKGSYYLIAIEEGKLMGWILIGASRDQFTDKTNGFIYELFVLEEFRGNGVSKQLMKTAIDELRQHGYSEVRLSAYAGNQAIKLYEKMGFNIRAVSMSLPL